jgi:hypothetical protein
MVIIFRFILGCAFGFSCAAMDFPILKKGTPLEFYYGCSDFPKSFETFHSGDTLGFFYDKIKPLVKNCHDMRVLMPNSECSLDIVEFFFCYSKHFPVYFSANNKSRVSSLVSKIEDLIDADTECVKNFYRETFKLSGKREAYFDQSIKEHGLWLFLGDYIKYDDSCGVVKQCNNLLEDYNYGFPKEKIGE